MTLIKNPGACMRPASSPYEGLKPFDLPSSSVPTQETNVPGSDISTPPLAVQHRNIEANFRHSGWLPDQARVCAGLLAAGATLARRVAFSLCGAYAVVVRDRNDPTRYSIRASYCHDRFCKPCSRARARVIANNVADIAPTNNLRFLTLTLSDRNPSLVRTLDRIYQAFRRLRAGTGWRRNVYGGAAFLETKWNPDSYRWHTHLHVIVEGDYYPQKQLKEEWTRATGGATIVHITRVRDRPMTLRYVTKYGTKAIDTATLRDPERLQEAIKALHGRRLVLTFGSWRALKTKPPRDTTEWEDVVTLSRLLINAAKGEADALYILGNLGYSAAHQTAIDAVQGPP